MSEKKKNVLPVKNNVLGCYPIPPLSVSRKENSNMIQISSTFQSVWRGILWSTMKFKIKVDKYFLQKHKEGPPLYVLAASIQDGLTGTLFHPSTRNFSIRFTSNMLEESTQALITMNPYNEVEVNIHQDMFKDEQSFFLLLEAIPCEKFRLGSPIIFGRSQMISVTNYALTIEESFSNNQYVTKLNGYDFAWYSKCGGENSGLDVFISIKNEHGMIIKSTENIQLITELVYSDGSPTPFMPLSPLKERRKLSMSRKTLYRPLRSEPVLGPDISTVPFCFRIEEVSFHHPGHTGFKLKVSCSKSSPMLVHPGILTENIIVLSKPKPEVTFNPSSFPMTLKDSQVCTPLMSNSDLEKDPIAFLPVDKLIGGLRKENGECLCCKKIISDSNFFTVESHEPSCHLVFNLFPHTKKTTLELTAVSKRTKRGHKGRKIRTSKPEEKREETSIIHTPCPKKPRKSQSGGNHHLIATTPVISNLRENNIISRRPISPLQSTKNCSSCVGLSAVEKLKVSPIRSQKFKSTFLNRTKVPDVGIKQYKRSHETPVFFKPNTPWPKKIKVEDNSSFTVTNEDEVSLKNDFTRVESTPLPTVSTLDNRMNKNTGFLNLFEASSITSKLSPDESISSGLSFTKSVTFDDNLFSNGLSPDSDVSPLFGRVSGDSRNQT